MPAFKAIHLNDYSLVGKDTALAIEKGLAEATWYTSPVPKEKMRELLQRRDWPAMRDTILWFALIIGSGWAGYELWQAGSWWAVVPFVTYGVLYASTSDSRWHESSHGTAFKTNWMVVSSLTPEFGPPPYLHTLPFTQAPVADLAEMCDWMARRQAARFPAIQSWCDSHDLKSK
jgi:hypothetical protein